MTELLKTSIKK